MKTSELNIQNLSIGYILKNQRKKLVKENISQQLYAGEVTCLIGSNGTGKSTLLRTIAGFQPALKGEILYKNKPVGSYSESERSLIIGLVLTDKVYAGGISVFDLVSLGRHPHTGFFGKLKNADKEIIYNSMEKTGIAHKSDSYVSELSDGERQKAMIAKTLAQECPVILLDEPTAFLDASSRIEIMYLLKELAKKENKSVLLSTHDIESAIRMGDRFWLMDKNRPFVSGIPEDLILDDIFSHFFNRENIIFNKQNGILQINHQTNSDVYLSGDATLSFWIGNALRKNGINPVIENKYPQINCLEKNNYIFMENEFSEKIVFKSIEKLIKIYNP